MKLSKRELAMLVLLLIVAVFFIELRFVINPMITQYDSLRSERDVVQDEVQMIELSMAIAKQNETKREESLEEIKKLSARYFGELQKDALLVRTHDLILEQGLNPTQYSLQPVQTAPLVPASYTTVELAYEFKSLAEAYRLLTEPGDTVIVRDDQAADEGGIADPVEQYQISFTVRGTYEQLNNYLDALKNLQRSLMVASLSLLPDTSQPGDGSDPGLNIPGQEPEEPEQFLSMQITLYYYGLTKLVPSEDTFNQWYRDPFIPVAFSPFKPQPVPVETIETVETTETEETTTETEGEATGD
jgi:Tfp pilus assembly protein PilO